MLKDTEMHEASRGISETAEQLLVGYYTILSLLLPATTQNWFKTNDANTNNNIKLYHDDNSDQQWRVYERYRDEVEDIKFIASIVVVS